MTKSLIRWAAVSAALIGAVACNSTDLAVENPNSGDSERVLGTPNDAEALLGTYYKRWSTGVYGTTGDLQGMASMMSLMNYSSLANNGLNTKTPFTGGANVNNPGTVVAVTHDRYFLDNAAEWILELDRGKGIPWKGNYTDWLTQKDARLKQEESGEKARQKAIQRELEWARSNAKGGRSKGKARLARIEELQAVDYQKRNETNEIFIPPGERLGQSVVEFKGVSKSFGDRLLIDDLSLIVPSGAIVGIIGPNGAGKSTLFKMITGQEKPDSGQIVMGPTVKLAYVDQSRDKLEGNHNVFQEVSGGADILNINGIEIQSRAYIGRFNFKGQDQQKLVGALSGGERGRLHLAKTLLQGGNVLLLDEPSNDLDIETLRALEDAILEFPGNVFVISHDRWFLDRIATHILSFEGDSHVEFFQGNYREYEEDKKRRLGAEGAQPHRLRFKALK